MQRRQTTRRGQRGNEDFSTKSNAFEQSPQAAAARDRIDGMPSKSKTNARNRLDAEHSRNRATRALRVDSLLMKALCESVHLRASHTPRKRAAALVMCIVLGTLVGRAAIAQTVDPACGNPFATTNGPFDYLVEQGPTRKVVEDNHFTPRVESLIAGNTSSLGGDLTFTLRAFPNHHRALFSIMNLGAKLKTPMPPGAEFTVECFFKRALIFRPNDSIARMIYAKYLATNGRKREATDQLEYAVQRSQDNAFTQYNAGLIFFEMREFDKALLQAHRALDMGFERPGLKQQLQAAGKWVDAAPIEPATAASSADSAMTLAKPSANAASQPSR